ncbi:MAG: hypothetical protein MK008_11175 [Bdellovibrionales bacterium]|nr:hypothetical protein [Bdellovibrionales bacterium]
MEETMKQLNAEERAFVYQQIQEFQPYLLPDSEVYFKVIPTGENNDEVEVEFTLTGGGGHITAKASGKDLYEATNGAKESLLEHFVNMIQSMTKDADLNAEMQMAQSQKYLH